MATEVFWLLFLRRPHIICLYESRITPTVVALGSGIHCPLEIVADDYNLHLKAPMSVRSTYYPLVFRIFCPYNDLCCVCQCQYPSELLHLCPQCTDSWVKSQISCRKRPNVIDKQCASIQNNLINHYMNFLQLLWENHWLSEQKKLIPHLPSCGGDHDWNFSQRRRS